MTCICHVVTEMKRLITRKCSKLAQKKFKTMHDWVGKIINWKLCKRLNLTIQPNSICTTQNSPAKMRHRILSDL